jgi:hypothetical protein
MSDDDVRAGEELAKAWLAGKSELIDDLAALVDGMDKPLDATARAFLQMIGDAAKASAKREARPTPSARRTPAPPPESTPAPVDLNEMFRRRRERERARRLEEFGRRNQEAFMEQRAFMAGNQTRNDADWRGGGGLS